MCRIYIWRGGAWTCGQGTATKWTTGREVLETFLHQERQRSLRLEMNEARPGRRKINGTMKSLVSTARLLFILFSPLLCPEDSRRRCICAIVNLPQGSIWQQLPESHMSLIPICEDIYVCRYMSIHIVPMDTHFEPPEMVFFIRPIIPSKHGQWRMGAAQQEISSSPRWSSQAFLKQNEILSILCRVYRKKIRARFVQDTNGT